MNFTASIFNSPFINFCSKFFLRVINFVIIHHYLTTSYHFINLLALLLGTWVPVYLGIYKRFKMSLTLSKLKGKQNIKRQYVEII